jgi:formylglycine-generating enzyme required for sulfatase activity
VFVDTDLPTRGQAEADETFSRDVAVDSLRVDVLLADGTVIDFRDFVAPDPRDWPISFGVLPSGGDQAITLRIRAFSGAIATPGTLAGASTIEPALETTVDRVVTLPIPTKGVSGVKLLLHGDCIGRPTSFASGITTCIDADHLAQAPSYDVAGTADVSPPKSAVGTWPIAREVACSAPPPDGTVCIPGGLSLMGDPVLDHANGYDTSPRHLVRLSPFYMDVTEMTVGRYRTLLNKKKVSAVPGLPSSDPTAMYCTFKGASTSKADALPLNCIAFADAVKACAVSAGTLPTEAQWEHAARGRGQGRRYPWGDDDPMCCAMCGSRPSSIVPKTECKGGIDPAGSHPPNDACGIGDQSRDGVLDLAGSVSEFMSNDYAPYESPCWSWQGYKADPTCAIGGLPAGRGSDWSAGLDTSASAMRQESDTGAYVTMGVRCVYPGVSQ